MEIIIETTLTDGGSKWKYEIMWAVKIWVGPFASRSVSHSTCSEGTLNLVQTRQMRFGGVESKAAFKSHVAIHLLMRYFVARLMALRSRSIAVSVPQPCCKVCRVECFFQTVIRVAQSSTSQQNATSKEERSSTHSTFSLRERTQRCLTTDVEHLPR